MVIKNKLIGYGVAGLGLVGLGVSTLNMFPGLPKVVLIIPSMILVIIGVVMLIAMGDKSKGKVRQVEKEVPIYKGKEIVGYRVEGE